MHGGEFWIVIFWRYESFRIVRESPELRGGGTGYLSMYDARVGDPLSNQFLFWSARITFENRVSVKHQDKNILIPSVGSSTKSDTRISRTAVDMDNRVRIEHT